MLREGNSLVIPADALQQEQPGKSWHHTEISGAREYGSEQPFLLLCSRSPMYSGTSEEPRTYAVLTALPAVTLGEIKAEHGNLDSNISSSQEPQAIY